MPAEDYLLSSYDYDLPPERIARYPSETPGGSRLLVMKRIPPDQETVPACKDAFFCDLASYLPPHALLVANNSRVLPARLAGKRPRGGKAEFLLLTPLPLLLENSGPDEDGGLKAFAECLLRPAAKMKIGMMLDLGDKLKAVIVDKGAFGRHVAELHWVGELEKIFEKAGSLPLPPYIGRMAEKSDYSRYQTVYAKKTGSVAAPTAGLHFTPAMCADLQKKGFEWFETTLHVGYGTFSPVRCADIREHVMHSEYFEVDEALAAAVQRAKKEGRPVVAVGTTSLRALESAAANGPLRPFRGWTDIFMYPGKKFNVVDGLLTNFHLPQSSLLMLVAAFAGRKRILSAYESAAALGYRFYSYGDAMLIC